MNYKTLDCLAKALLKSDVNKEKLTKQILSGALPLKNNRQRVALLRKIYKVKVKTNEEA